MEWSYIAIGVVVFASLIVYFRPQNKSKTLLESMIDEQGNPTDPDDPLQALKYQEANTFSLQGLTEDGWLQVYTTTESKWFGHELFQTLTSMGCMLDEQQCLVYSIEGRRLFKIIKATDPVTFDTDTLGQEMLTGVVWLFDCEQEDAVEAFKVMKETCQQFMQEMNAQLVNQQKQVLPRTWFSQVEAYLVEQEKAEA